MEVPESSRRGEANCNKPYDTRLEILNGIRVDEDINHSLENLNVRVKPVSH